MWGWRWGCVYHTAHVVIGQLPESRFSWKKLLVNLFTHSFEIGAPLAQAGSNSLCTWGWSQTPDWLVYVSRVLAHDTQLYTVLAVKHRAPACWASILLTESHLQPCAGLSMSFIYFLYVFLTLFINHCCLLFSARSQAMRGTIAGPLTCGEL